MRLSPGGLYAWRFFRRREAGATGGTAISGLSRLNRDFPMDGTWRTYEFVLSVPDDGARDCVRLGQ